MSFFCGQTISLMAPSTSILGIIFMKSGHSCIFINCLMTVVFTSSFCLWFSIFTSLDVCVLTVFLLPKCLGAFSSEQGIVFHNSLTHDVVFQSDFFASLTSFFRKLPNKFLCHWSSITNVYVSDW